MVNIWLYDKKPMKNKGFKTIFVISILLVLADLISTLLCGNMLIKYLESNPMYKYGGLTLIIFINILVFWYFWWVYHKEKIVQIDGRYIKKVKVTDRYFCILAMVMIAGVRCLAIYGNLNVAFVQPQEIAEEANVSIEQAKIMQLDYAKTVTEEQKWEYGKQLIMPYLVPYILVIIVWFLFKMDHKVEVYDG